MSTSEQLHRAEAFKERDQFLRREVVKVTSPKGAHGSRLLLVAGLAIGLIDTEASFADVVEDVSVLMADSDTIAGVLLVAPTMQLDIAMQSAKHLAARRMSVHRSETEDLLQGAKLYILEFLRASAVAHRNLLVFEQRVERPDQE